MRLRSRVLQAFHPALQYLGGNRIDLLCNGGDYFAVLLSAINSARDSIRLETYLYADDRTGDLITTALCQAAHRGVDVRLVVDGFGARNIDQRHRPQLETAGVQLRVFRPEHALLGHLLSLQRSRLCRMHRKLALIDGATAFVGGINIIDDATGNAATVRLDFALRITGQLIAPIGQAMDRQWQTLHRLGRVTHHATDHRFSATALHAAPTGTQHAALALRDNLLNRRTIEQAYLCAIRQSRDHITLAMAYFIPSRKILNALLQAAERGVRVTLLVQGRVEYRLQHYASQALYSRLLAQRIRIHEYQPGFLHAKVAVIDGLWATVGSANLDPFSLLVAREANVVIRDAGFARHLQTQLDHAIHQHSREITLQTWATQPGHHKLLRGICAGILFRLLSLTGYGNNY